MPSDGAGDDHGDDVMTTRWSSAQLGKEEREKQNPMEIKAKDLSANGAKGGHLALGSCDDGRPSVLV